MIYCYHCMTKIENDNAVYCPECGNECRVHYPESFELPAGTTLSNGRYLVGKSLGSGGFGITYIGRDLNLDKRVVIKETYYNGFFSRNIYNKKLSNPLSVIYSGISFDKISSKARKESYTLASAEELDNIVKVYDYFSENNTSYIVTEYIEGETLWKHVQTNGRYDFDELYKKIKPLIESLSELHSMDIIHRDIKPENIMLKANRRNDLKFVLIDFGLAHSTSVQATISTGLAFSPGYSPFEQRSFKGVEGTFIDVYALAATMYFALTGEAPDIGVSDDIDVNFPKLKDLSEKYGVPKHVEAALRHALNPDYRERTQSLEIFVEEIESPVERITKPKINSSETIAVFEKPESQNEFATQIADRNVINSDIEEFLNAPQVIFRAALPKKSVQNDSIEPKEETENRTSNKPEPKKENPNAKFDSSKSIVKNTSDASEGKKKSKAVLFVIAAVLIVWIVFGAVKMTDIIDISGGVNQTVGLKKDGTVVAVGYNEYGQCDVSDWKNIVAVSTGRHHTVGLKKDGTVVAIGLNEDGQCDVSGWNDITAIWAGGNHTVGLKKDGTVAAVGFNTSGQCDVSGWNDITAIWAGGNHTVGLKKDGTVVAVGDNTDGQCDVSGWNDITVISAGGYHTVGLKKDGTVVAIGTNEEGQCDVSDW